MNNMRNNSLLVDLIDCLSILGIFSDKIDGSNTTTQKDEIEDLGYAVVIDDEGNEIKNY
jgi:hypothetical protein